MRATGAGPGQVRRRQVSIRGESIPTAVRLSETAYWSRPDITISGQFKDADDTDNDDPVFDVQSHKDRAGNISRSTGAWRSALTMSPSYGWIVYITTALQATPGPLLVNTANDPTGFYEISNKLVYRWCRGDNTRALIENLSENATITFIGGTLQGHSQGSKRLFDMPDTSVGDGQKLFANDLKIYGCANANQVLEDGVSLGTEWTGWGDNVFSDPDREIVVDDDEDEDLAGGSGTSGIGEPEE